MKKNQFLRLAVCFIVVLAMLSTLSTISYAKEKTYLVNGEKIVFDAEYYASTYADVKNAIGTGEKALLNHYITYGRKEGRSPYKKAESIDPGKVEQALFAEINSIRNKAGVSSLTLSPELNKVAAVRAKEMAGYFSHTRPDGADYSTAFTAVNSKYATALIGENAAMTGTAGLTNSGVASSEIKTMKGSADHFARMTNSDFRYVGISSYQVGEKNYIVLEFSNN